MVYFFTNDITKLDMFKSIDFTLFSEFELLISTIVYNLFVAIFLYIMINLLIKIIVRLKYLF